MKKWMTMAFVFSVLGIVCLVAISAMGVYCIACMHPGILAYLMITTLVLFGLAGACSDIVTGMVKKGEK